MDRQRDRRLPPKRFNGNVGAGSPGDGPHGVDHLALIQVARVDHAVGTDPRRGLQGALADVDTDNPSADRLADHHRTQADPAASDNEQPFACGQRGPMRHPAVGGGEAAAEQRRSAAVDLIRNRDEILVGTVQRDELRIGAPVREARLGLVAAHLPVATEAFWAVSAGAHERCRDSLTHRKPADVVADRVDDADKFVPWDVRQRDPGIVSLPAVDVAAAQASGLHPDDHTITGRHGVCDLRDDRRLPEGIEVHCAHGTPWG